MLGRSKEDPRSVRNRETREEASAWIGRVFATMIFMVGPGAAGLWLDRQLGTRFLAAIGIVVGMVLGTSALLTLSKVKRAPKKSNATNSDAIDSNDVTSDSNDETGHSGSP